MNKNPKLIRLITIGLALFGLTSMNVIAQLKELRKVASTNSAISTNDVKLASNARLGVVFSCTVATALTPVEVESTLGIIIPTVYANLQSAFAAINAGTHQGNISIEVCFNSTEPVSAVLNSSGAGPASYANISLYPLADGISISGNPGAGRGLIELNGADNVTFNGDNPNTAGTNQNLSITNTALATTTLGSVIRIANSATVVTSSDNISLRNMILNGNVTGGNSSTITGTTTSSNSSFGIYVGGNGGASAIGPPIAITTVAGQTIPAGTTVNNLVIDNNVISQTARAIVFNGTAVNQSTGVAITNNVIGNPVAGSVTGVYSMGITVQGTSSLMVRNNRLYVESFLAAAVRAIDIGSINSNVAGVTVEQNQVLRVQNNNIIGNGAYGINLGGGSSHIVRNNFVSGVANTPGTGGSFSPTTGAFGIRINAGSGHAVYHNSVNMFGDLVGTAQALTAALGITLGSLTGIDARNNILVNTQTQTGAITPTASAFVAIYLPSGAGATMNLTLNKNDYYIGSSPAVYNGYGQAGITAGVNFFSTFDASQTSPATNLRSYTSVLDGTGNNDNASIAANPQFLSNTNLHVAGASPVINAGINVGVTNDIDGQARPYGAGYDIGADEVVPSAAGVSLGGRVLTADGRGIRNAVVTVEGGNLQVPMTALTGPFGYYRFDDLPAGLTYVLTVRSKRYTFENPTRAVNLDDELTDVDFVAEP